MAVRRYRNRVRVAGTLGYSAHRPLPFPPNIGLVALPATQRERRLSRGKPIFIPRCGPKEEGLLVNNVNTDVVWSADKNTVVPLPPGRVSSTDRLVSKAGLTKNRGQYSVTLVHFDG